MPDRLDDLLQKQEAKWKKRLEDQRKEESEPETQDIIESIMKGDKIDRENEGKNECGCVGRIKALVEALRHEVKNGWGVAPYDSSIIDDMCNTLVDRIDKEFDIR